MKILGELFISEGENGQYWFHLIRVTRREFEAIEELMESRDFADEDERLRQWRNSFRQRLDDLGINHYLAYGSAIEESFKNKRGEYISFEEWSKKMLAIDAKYGERGYKMPPFCEVRNFGRVSYAQLMAALKSNTNNAG